MGSCLSVRVGAAAIVGYSIGAFAGSATIAWLLAVVAAAAMVLWSRLAARRGDGACATGCGPSRRWRRSRGSSASRARQPGQLPSREMTPT